MTRALLAAALAVLAVGCYDEPRPVCGFFCGPSSACPADYECGAEGRCRLVGAPASTVCAGIDAAIDAAPDMAQDASLDDAPDAEPDAPVDATPDAPADAEPDAMVDAMPDGMVDAMVDAMPDAP